MKRLVLIIVVVAAGCWWFLLRDATPHPRWPAEIAQASLRHTDSGPVVGYLAPHGTYGWLGIPYARAPIGELRWRAPRSAMPWEDPHRALSPAPVCPQIGGRLAGVPESQYGSVVGDEDCLVLNLWAPRSADMDEGRGLPVMVWIHGGGNTIGFGADYDGSHLSGRHDLIVVTINYRLGVLGWFSHEGLRQAGASPEDASGNFGTLDTIFALGWVRDNIQRFGGDPNNVTIFGESAGGRNTYALLDSPRAKGLFHRAIIQSGATRRSTRKQGEAPQSEGGHQASSGELTARWLVTSGEAENEEAARELQAQWSPTQTMHYLRKLPAELLLSEFTGLSGMYRSPQLFKDGVVLPDRPPEEIYADPELYNAVPVIMGTNRDEAKLFLAQNPSLVDETLGIFVRLKNADEYQKISDFLSLQWKALGVDGPASLMRQAQGPSVYAYRFDWDDSGKNILADFSTLLGAAHGLEIPFVFGNFEAFFGISLVFNDDNKQARLALSDAMMSYWAEFAYSGSPGTGRDKSLPLWQPWSDEQRSEAKYLIFDTEVGGGLRMHGELVSMDALRNQVVASREWTDPRKHCELYAQIFRNSKYWVQAEYESLNDQCSALDPGAVGFY